VLLSAVYYLKIYSAGLLEYLVICELSNIGIPGGEAKGRASFEEYVAQKQCKVIVLQSLCRSLCILATNGPQRHYIKPILSQ
jgi:hypothetical protein